MSNGLKVNPAEMLMLGKETIEKAVALKGQIDSLISNKNNLMAIWHGDAANAFEETVTSQMKNLEAFKILIEELGGRIISGANSFSQTEQRSVEEAKKLRDKANG